MKLAKWIGILMALGLLAELSLIGHYEGVLQYVPIVIIAIFLLAISLYNRLNISRKILKSIFILTIMSGIAGIFLHLQSNFEFEIEMYSDLSTKELIYNSLTGAIPALAPGVLIPLGLIGYLIIDNNL